MKTLPIFIFLFLSFLLLTDCFNISSQPESSFQQDRINDFEHNTQRIFQSNVKSISMRLTPNQDIVTQITTLLKNSRHSNKFTALSIVSAVGSVNYCWIRLANQPTLTKFKGPMEIVSFSGTIDLNYSPHIHIAFARPSGETIGGHLPSLQERQQAIKMNSGEQNDQTSYDCPTFTTLELALLSHEDIIYQRKIDSVTTFHELTIRKKHFYSK